MNIESLRNFALSMDDVEESTPFGPDVLVFKTKGKIFLLLPLDTEALQFNVKCNPEEALQLRENYPEAVLPGYHMNKKHWNTVIVDHQLTEKILEGFVITSYNLVSPKKNKSKKSD